MLIAVPTRGRAHMLEHATLKWFSPDVLSNTVLFTHIHELDTYQDAMPEEFYECGVQIVPLHYETISQKRTQIGLWAMENYHEKFAMFDDDLEILVRKSATAWNLRKSTWSDVELLVNHMDFLLDDFAHVGVSAREGNNRFGEGHWSELYLDSTRAMRIAAYRTRMYVAADTDRVPLMEDFDITLQLLKKGFANRVLGYWASGQGKTQSFGGCSDWRDLTLHNRTANKMKELHPGFVTTRQKKNKTDADGFGSRTEVTVQWKQAWRMGVAAHGEAPRIIDTPKRIGGNW